MHIFCVIVSLTTKREEEKMKKWICCLFVCVFCFSSMPVLALAQDTMMDEEGPVNEAEYDYDPVEPGFVSQACMEVNDPQEDGEPEDTVAPRSIVDVTESTDRTIILDSLTDQAANSEGDCGNLKNLIRRADMIKYVKTQFPVSSSDIYKIYMQGGCSDGKYSFFAFTVAKNQHDAAHMLGVVFLTCHEMNGKLTIDSYHSTAGNAAFKAIGHCNSMTYNSRKDQIVVACGDDKKQTAYTFNASYLRGETTKVTLTRHYVSCRFVAIAYNATLNRYVVNVSGQRQSICVLDSDFNLIAYYKNADEPKVKAGQAGLYCDDSYIYLVYGLGDLADDASKKVQTVMGIFNWSGKLVKEVNLGFNRSTHYGYADHYETENLIVCGNKVYMGFNCTYSEGSKRIPHYYYYDLSSRYFHIQYCPDENTAANAQLTNKTYQSVLYQQSTKIRKNTFTKTGYKFAGWTLYIPGEDIWSYKNNAGDIKWCKAGQQPTGYKKSVYADKQSVSQTVKSGKTVMFCATWKATKDFYVSFNANGGSGSMAMQTVTYDVEKTMPKNAFTKSGRKFTGWMIYSVERGEWIYKKADGTTAWYKEGEAPVGALKHTYKNQTTIARTVKAGQHVIFYARWNEFTILFDANGKRVHALKDGGIKTPIRAVYGNTTAITKYATGDTEEGSTCTGYRQHRLELDKWRYQSKTDASQTPWYRKSAVNTDKYKLYLFTGSTVKETVQIGERVVFQAQWK